MKVAVTGGAGFIGSHLVDGLLGEGHEVTVIDDLSSGKNLNPKASLVKQDIRGDLSRALRGMEAVFHLAAMPDVRESAGNPMKSFDNNVHGTFSVLESCRKADVKRVLFASTSTVYGETGGMPMPEEAPCRPISNYGASKAAGEAYLSAYSGSYGMTCTSLRLANVFGERNTRGVMFDFHRKLSADPGKLEILGDGNQERSYIHVSDVVSAFITAWKSQKQGYDVFNAGTAERITVREIAEALCEELELEPKLIYTGGERGWTGDVRCLLLNTRKLEALGWKAKTGFREGLNRWLNGEFKKTVQDRREEVYQ